MFYTLIISLLIAPLYGATDDAAMLQGIVTNAETGRPLPGATVRVLDISRVTQTDSLGHFRFPNLPDDAYRLEIRHVGFHTRAIELPDQLETSGLRITLTPRSIPLDDLAVVAQPDDGNIRQPSFSVVIPRESFEGQATALPEILARTTGLQVRSLGGLGAFSTISVRGSSSEQVEVYLDGISLNAALGGGVDLSNLPLSHIERIEIQRGAGQEGGGLGGTVHLRTRAPNSSHHDVSASWGSFDTRAMNAMLTTGSGRWRGFIVVDYTASDNNFRFLDDNGTEYNANDDAFTERRNSDLLSGSLLAKSRHTLTETRSLSLHQTLFWKHQGIPGLSNNQSTDARFDTFRSLTEAVYEDRSFLGRAFARHALYFTHTGESFRDKLGEVGVGRQDNEDRTRSVGLRSETRWPTASGHLIRVTGGVGRESYDPTAHIQLITPLFAATRWKFDGTGGLDLSLPHRIGIWSSRFQVRRIQSRLEGRNPFAFSPQAPDSSQTEGLFSTNTGIRLDLLGPLAFKANVGRSERAPSFYELFGDRGGVVGNTHLEPERAITWDAGWRYETPAVSAEAVYFDHRYKDLIQFFQTSQATSRPHNIGQARVRGLEFSSTAAIDPVTVSANYTLQNAIDRSNIPSQRGNALPNRPRHELSARATARVGHLTVRYDYTFEDGNFLDPANRRPLAARHLHGAGLNVEVTRHIRLSIETKNITNAQVNDVWGYPLPGRAWFIRLKNAS